jgi:hypothetical protein
MRHAQEHTIEMVNEVRQRLASRRGLLKGTAALTSGAALALAGIPALRDFEAAAQDVGDDEISVLNYALTLEHLETAFYRDGLASLTLPGDRPGAGEHRRQRLHRGGPVPDRQRRTADGGADDPRRRGPPRGLPEPPERREPVPDVLRRAAQPG